MQGMLTARGVFALLLMLSLAALGGCKSGGQSGPPVPGLGQSGATPSGSTYNMPAGISINNVTGATHANNSPDAIQCDGTAVASGSIYGMAMGYVDLCVQILNGNGAPTNVTLPAGLIFVAQNPPGVTPSQNGFLAQEQQISVPPGTVTIVVRAYCINKPFAAADGHAYDNRVILTDYAPLMDIANIIKGKQITTYQQAQVVQDAVWQVADGSGLSADNRTKLQNL